MKLIRPKSQQAFLSVNGTLCRRTRIRVVEDRLSIIRATDLDPELRYGSSEVGTDNRRHKFFSDILQVQPKNHPTVRSQHFKSRAMRNFRRFEEWNQDCRNASINRVSESIPKAKFERRISRYPNSRFRIQTLEPL